VEWCVREAVTYLTVSFVHFEVALQAINKIFATIGFTRTGNDQFNKTTKAAALRSTTH
jgi:hypothetical protein